MKVDPTVVSAPMIMTLVDGTGLYIYLRVAAAIRGL
jgi:Mg/Co/Ni transporter MgtE